MPAEQADAENTTGRNVRGGYWERERRSKCHERSRYQIGNDSLANAHWCNLPAQSMCYANCPQRSSDCDYQSYEEQIHLYLDRGTHQYHRTNLGVTLHPA